MKRMARALEIVILFGMASCASPLAIETGQSPIARFDRYRTFAFETGSAPPGFTSTERSAYVKQRVEEIAKPILVAKGYAFVEQSPDVTLRILAGRREAVVWERDPSAPRFCRTKCDVSAQILEGRFTIDVVDASTADVVWHGAATAKLEAGADDHLREAVQRVLDALPAR